MPARIYSYNISVISARISQKLWTLDTVNVYNYIYVYYAAYTIFVMRLSRMLISGGRIIHL